jgi:hypothetical protein
MWNETAGRSGTRAGTIGSSWVLTKTLLQVPSRRSESGCASLIPRHTDRHRSGKALGQGPLRLVSISVGLRRSAPMLGQTHRYSAKCSSREDKGSKWQPDNRASGGGCGYVSAAVKSFNDWVVNTINHPVRILVITSTRQKPSF